MKTYILLTFLLLSILGIAQIKYEKEVRIKSTEVPIKAKKFIDSLSIFKKVKWYKEVSINKTSIEAKSKHLGKRYSIEFSEEGLLEDVEVELKKKDVPTQTYQEIDKYLKSVHQKYEFEKVQIQYIGNVDAILSYLRKKERTQKITINYEIIITAKTDKIFKMYEYLFSEEGEFIHKSEIVEKNLDNLEY